jgi:hypothetical protein
MSSNNYRAEHFRRYQPERETSSYSGPSEEARQFGETRQKIDQRAAEAALQAELKEVWE